MALQVGSVGEELNLTVRQGADFGPLEFRLANPDLSPVDLTGVIIRGQIRKTPTSPVKILDFMVEVPNPTGGVAKVWLTSNQTKQLKAVDDPKSSENRYFYDLEIQDSVGRVLPWYHGTVMVFREVTR